MRDTLLWILAVIQPKVAIIRILLIPWQLLFPTGFATLGSVCAEAGTELIWLLTSTLQFGQPFAGTRRSPVWRDGITMPIFVLSRHAFLPRPKPR